MSEILEEEYKRQVELFQRTGAVASLNQFWNSAQQDHGDRAKMIQLLKELTSKPPEDIC